MKMASVDDADRVSMLVAALRQHCGPGDARPHVVKAPGRVNLIGEHTDYNDGFVLPIAIDRSVIMAGRCRPDRQVRVYSVDYQQLNEFSLDDIAVDNVMGWSNYIRGVLFVLQNEGYELGGLDLAVTGNIPQGAGLSSSAALEIATADMATALFDLKIEPVDTARLAQKAENEFVGVQCGIMDQFVSKLGRKDHALLIDCRSLEYRHIPWLSDQVRLLIADTRVQRGLVDSEYNRRRQECEEGLQALSKVLPGITALRDVSISQFREHAHLLDPVVRSRCRHVIYENARVLEAVAALESGDWVHLGQLMYASHESLRDLYEVSCPELNAMVEIAQSVEGVFGARMTGAGFGGCAIALVQERALENLEEAILRRYPEMIGRDPKLLRTGVAEGARSWLWEDQEALKGGN
ncbi:MAG: galactokinase [Limnochordia bacterium]|jgi:galactokinase